MYTVSWFGNRYQGTGTIRQILNDNGHTDFNGQEPYVNGQAISFDQAAAAGSTVTFRPKASGKAKNSGKRRGR